jgi:integrase
MPTIRVLVRKKPDRQTLQLYYVDPLTGLDRTKSAKTNNWKDAERAATNWETKLAERAVEEDPSWDKFRSRYEDEYLASKGARTQETGKGGLNNFERLMGHPRRLSAVTSSILSTFAAELRREKKSEMTIHGNLGHLRVALRWAARMELIRHVPYFPMPRLGDRRLMRGRRITTEEYERILAAVPAIRRNDAQQWKDLIEGLWLSGLRIDEARRLTWEQSSFCVDLTGPHPRFRILAEGQKRRRDELLPMAPEFAAWLLKRLSQSGKVFPVVNHLGKPFSIKRLINFISDIGEKAGIVADVETKKHATAHDLRRSFGTRWAMRVRPVTLQKLMRHANIATTMKYYVDLDVEDVEAEIWSACTPACTPEKKESEPASKRTPKKTSRKTIRRQQSKR